MPNVIMLFDGKGIAFDALLSEQNNISATVTTYPLEDGTVVSDNINVSPMALSISGVVTGALLSGTDGGMSKIVHIRKKLLDLMNEGMPVSLTTGLGQYDDMAITSLNISRTAPDGSKLDVDMELQRIRFVDVATERMPLAAPDVQGMTAPTTVVQDVEA